jgi:hypothetical protein
MSYKVAKADENDHTEVINGIKRKTLVYGDKTLLTEFILEKGKILPITAIRKNNRLSCFWPYNANH